MDNTLTIKEYLTLLPELPGVYLMYNSKNKILYIGKAKNLKKRVKSYFNKNHDSPKLAVMVPQIVKFEFIITDSEVEALILESHLIKKNKPKYNVLLKDDKRFPWFLITSEEYPRIIVTRKINQKAQKGRFFGPYTNARAMYSTLALIKKMFPLKQCKRPKSKDRPCLYYQIGKCLAPCQKLVTPKEYKKVVNQVALFLSGKQSELLAELKKQMELSAENQEYEKAGRYRDSYFDVMKAIGKQKIVTSNTAVNQDIVGIAHEETMMSIALLKVRDGRLIAKEDFDIKLDSLHSKEEALVAFLQEYYQLVSKADIPKELLIPCEINKEDKRVIKEWLNSKKTSKFEILTPKLQKKYELVEMANKNALANLERLKLSEMTSLQNDWNEVGNFIQEKLKLPKFPNRIECFDISHIQGTNTVASMAVFINGKPHKSEYRKYKIKTLKEGEVNDFAAIQEVIKRRCKKLLNDIEKSENNQKQIMPDLMIIDGGKGQLSSAIEVFEELGLCDIPIVSLAKRLEEVYLPNNSEPIILPENSKSLFLVQQLRDESHRFAVAYHRKLREKKAITSILDEITGLTITNKKLLFEHFGDINGIISSNKSELARIIGKYYGYKVYRHLNKKNKD